MIILNPYGGLGNQMYGYAYAKSLSEEYGEEIYINVFWIRLHGFLINLKHVLCKEKRESCEDLLGCLYCANDIRKMKIFPAIFHGLRLEIFMVWSLIFRHPTVTNRADYFLRDTKRGYFGALGAALSYFPAEQCKRKYKYVFGCPSSEKYFIKISKQLKKTLKVSEIQSRKNTLLMEEIKNCNSICLHIRRGDYITNESYNYLKVCTESYYINCMDYIKKYCKNPVFYVFSNNHEEICWIKENYKLEGNIKYVDLGNPNYEELRLMYSCKHFIISNSSFSWWASFLAENQNKIVLAPEKWFAEYEGSMDVYRTDMIRISGSTRNSFMKGAKGGDESERC